MTFSFKEIIKCGNKYCNHIATNKKINKLQSSFIKETFDKCKDLKDKPKSKRKCVENKKKTSSNYKKFKTLYNKRTKCMTKNCESKRQLNKIINKSKKKNRKK